MKTSLANRLIGLKRYQKQVAVILLDVGLGALATWLAFSIRLDAPHMPRGNEIIPYWFGPLLALPIFIHFGLYRAVFRYTDLSAIKQILKAIALYAAIYTAVLLLFHIKPLPRSLGVLQPFILSAFIAGSRMLARFWLLSSQVDPRLRLLRRRLLIVGTQSEAVQLANALERSPEYVLVGFADDDRQLIGRNMLGQRVFAIDDLKAVITDYEISDLVICLGPNQRHKRQEVINKCDGMAIRIQSAEFRMDSQDATIKELGIEDLLGRTHVPPDVNLLKLRNLDRRVLVTGAGGSIGSELCRQILSTNPKCLILFEMNEFSLYSIHHELERTVREYYPTVELRPVLGDVRDIQRIQEVFDLLKPDTVYHAAAYKHVPLVEMNPFEGIRNNFLGTYNCGVAAQKSGVKDFVLVSTDKAVRPTNIMGASKRMAELALQALAQGSETTFSMVRFGNVLGSSGSVVPLFRKQIAQLGPVTITHPDVTRFFMTIPEAAQLVIQAGAMAKGGEVFVLDMGQPIKILDLARKMISMAGYKVRSDESPLGEIELVVTGLRPGEKLYEELLIGKDPKPTEHPKILTATEDFISKAELEKQLVCLNSILERRDVPALKDFLIKLVEGYQPESETHDSLANTNC